MLSPSLLDEYPMDVKDFEGEEFHQIMFAAIYNLYMSGANKMDSFAIDSYLSNYEKKYAVFNANKGVEYCEEAVVLAEETNFVYYYERMRKLSYLRDLKRRGVDTKLIYDDTVIDPTQQDREMEKLDSLTMAEISEAITSNLSEATAKYVDNTEIRGQQAGKGLRELKEKLKEQPEIGIPMQSPILNTIVRGARLKKFYLRSGNTGSGKTRTGMGDICSYSIPWFYDLQTKSWHYTGFSCPAAFISTEIEESDLQTLVLAYVSGVDETHICDGAYGPGEEERVDKAIEYIESSPLHFIVMEDFDLKDLENTIRKYKREFGVQYFAFDYIQNTVKMMQQMRAASGARGLREDQILLLMSTELKNMCNRLNVHIDSFTQVNGEYVNVKEKNQNIIAGGKAIANKIDVGIISLPPSPLELETVQKKILSHKIGCPIPNLIYHIYKVRKGKLSRIMLWLKADLGTCRTTDLFVTDLNYNEIPVERITIENVEAVLDETDIDSSDVEMTMKEQEEATKALFSW